MGEQVGSARDAARLAAVGYTTIRRWIASGRLPGPPPWTAEQVERAAASDSPSQRGPREPHATLGRYRHGCPRTSCRAANTADKHPEQNTAEVARQIEPLLDDLANGTPYPTALATHGYSRQKITSLRRLPIITQALDAALMAGRDPDLAHGTPGAWRAGCRCPDCSKYHDGTRP